MEMKDAIKKVTLQKDLTEDEARSVFTSIMDGEATPAQIGGLLVALAAKGETVDEITGAARVMREKSLKVSVREGAIDTCGTGGTGKSTFNISTTVAFVVAGSGVTVAKHGNRAASGKCGSADVLEKLGVKIDVSPEVTEKCLEEINIGFLFAPLYHGAMKHAIGPRKELGIRTIFNILGPLSNPASVDRQVIGVFDASLTETIAGVLGRLGSKHAYVVHGEGMFDEVSLAGKTKVSELNSGEVTTYEITPEDFGIKTVSDLSVSGGTLEENARVVAEILSGQKKGQHLDLVLMNASLALMAAGKASDLKEGVRIAKESIDSGEAKNRLDQLARMTNS